MRNRRIAFSASTERPGKACVVENSQGHVICVGKLDKWGNCNCKYWARTGGQPTYPYKTGYMRIRSFFLRPRACWVYDGDGNLHCVGKVDKKGNCKCKWGA